MLEWLLKYPPEWYARGSIDIAWPWPAYALAVACAVAVLFWLSGYRRLYGGTPSFLLRAALIAVLLFALANPMLTVEAPEPIRGHVAVLLDDSLSMRIADAGGATAAERLETAFGNGAESIALDERFDTRRFRFGDGVRPLAPGEPLRYADARSELGAALLRAATGHDAGSLASVVVASDGGGSPPPAARARLDTALLALRAAGVPVHVVALGGGAAGPDLELRSMRIPRQVLIRDDFHVDLELVQTGFGGERVALVIEDDGIIVDRHELTLPRDREQLSVRRRLSFDEAGRRLLTARVSPLPGELVRENNHLERSIDVTDDPIRVLHFEGEPRFEVKFVRRAVAEDPAIRLASLVRTADNKYYRLGVEEPSDLAGGFPDDAAELFEYDVLILGSVEAALLEPDQQTAIRDFVARRGGGLLLLGGQDAFAEGGHGRSSLAEIMPVLLDDNAAAFRAEVQVQPTAAGRGDPLLDFADAEPGGNPLFQDLPPLTVINPHREAKPGATVLLQAEDASGEPLIVLASQQYGRGRVMSFAVTNSWRWQMSVQNPLTDQTHERLWRALLRDLGRQAGGRLRLTLDQVESTPGRPVSVDAQALDALYHPLAHAALTLAVTTPLGEIHHYPMTRPADARGQYQAQFVPRRPGRHDLAVELRENGEVVASAREHVDVTTTGREFHERAQGHHVLERIAAETGGRLVEPANAGELANLVDDTRGTRTVVKSLPLWDAPILLFVMLLLGCADWMLRRRRKLA